MATTLGQFLRDASYCFVKKNSMEASMFKTGQTVSQAFTTEVTVLGMYFWMLHRIGNNYALTSDEVEAVMAHILKLCRRKDLEVPNGTSVVGGSIPGPIGVDVGTVVYIYPPVYTTSYSGVESFQVVVNHNLNKLYPDVIVVDTSGVTNVRVYPSITYVTNNQLILDFVSTSLGVITVV